MQTVLDLVQENDQLKRQLSHFISEGKKSNELLDVLEGYHNAFINKDTHLSLLIQDIRRQEMFAKSLANEKVKDLNFEYQQHRLQFEVDKMAEEFQKLKQKFELLLGQEKLD